jgi:C-terminal processing protease CtpA/Prc
MKVLLRLMHGAVGLILIFSSVLIVGAQQLGDESARIDRLVGIAKLWAAVKYFHPYLAYRDDIDWDRALVEAIPKVDAARNQAEYEAAVAGMLNTLGDPATRVLEVPAPTKSSTSGERQPTFRRNVDDVLVVSMTNYSDLQDYYGPMEKLEALKKELPTVRAVVFDLRPRLMPSEAEQGFASYAVEQSGIVSALTSVSLDLPGERRRLHIGYAPQGVGSEDYSSGFYLRGRRSIKSDEGAKPIPVVFLISPHADLPVAALGLQASGRGAIVAEGSASEEGAVTTQTVKLLDGVRAQIRSGELVYADGSGGFFPNLIVPPSSMGGEQNPAFQAAIQLAKTGRFSPPPRAMLAGWAAPLQDKDYADRPYPAAEYRLLAAFRIWAVINYFYPYKELMGEDWNQTLRQFIPRMEGSKDALDYNLAVAEMVTHIHDSHGSARSPILQRYFGEASAPVRVRMIENSPVITGFTNTDAAQEAGLEIGDVILKVDGEDANRRIAERLKYTASSTPESGIFYATERSLVRGPKDSTATFAVRDLHNQVREVKVARKVEYMPKTQGDRSGDVLRVLPGNIGYADLDRLPMPLVDEMFEKFKNCTAIIFDNRGYPRGTGGEIAARLTDKTDVQGEMYKRRELRSVERSINTPVLESEVLETFFELLPRSDKSRYHGRTVMLIDERAVSQAEEVGLFFEMANGTKFIGSATAGANGDVTTLSVPGGIYVRFTGQAVLHADGRQLQRVGLQPDVEVHPTLAGIRAGTDEVLEKAIDYLEHSPQK